MSDASISTPSPNVCAQDDQCGTFSVPVDNPHDKPLVFFSQLLSYHTTPWALSRMVFPKVASALNLNLHHSISVFSLADNNPSIFFISCLFLGIMESPPAPPSLGFLTQSKPFQYPRGQHPSFFACCIHLADAKLDITVTACILCSYIRAAGYCWGIGHMWGAWSCWKLNGLQSQPSPSTAQLSFCEILARFFFHSLVFHLTLYVYHSSKLPAPTIGY